MTNPLWQVECIARANALYGVLMGAIGDTSDMKNRDGGYLCVANSAGVPVLIMRMGEPLEEKHLSYFRNAIEKADRLGIMQADIAPHLLSRHTRNPSCERWGGAVKGSRFIWSSSGFSEEVNEMLSLALAVAMGDFDKSAAKALMDEVENTYRETLGFTLDRIPD